MIVVRQHIPGFVSGFEPEMATVENTSDVLALPWVRQWLEIGWHFCRNDNLLMIERDDNAEWLVVAHVDGQLDLPEWDQERAMKAKKERGR